MYSLRRKHARGARVLFALLHARWEVQFLTCSTNRERRLPRRALAYDEGLAVELDPPCERVGVAGEPALRVDGARRLVDEEVVVPRGVGGAEHGAHCRFRRLLHVKDDRVVWREQILRPRDEHVVALHAIRAVACVGTRNGQLARPHPRAM
eukprot:6208725-Pleurochrysis_carterae.AAC.1